MKMKIMNKSCTVLILVALIGAAHADWVTTTVPAGNYPCAVAVNPVTNKIYVTNCNSDDVTVIDGATNDTTTVPAGNGPNAVAVNPVTNKIYVANYGNDVTMRHGGSALEIRNYFRNRMLQFFIFFQ